MTGDMWIDKFILFLLVATTGYAVYSTKNGGVTCWSPAHMEVSHLKYANTICSTKGMYHYPVDFSDTLNRAPRTQVAKESQIPKLLQLQTIEIFLVLISFAFLKYTTTNSHSQTRIGLMSAKELLKRYFKVPVYVLIQLGLAVAWLILGLMSHKYVLEATRDTESLDAFLCDFEVRQLTNVHSYIVQCVVNEEDNQSNIFFANIGLCLVVFVMKVIHILDVVVTCPCSGRFKAIGKRMEKEGVVKNVKQLGWSFAFSDLHFAIISDGEKVFKLNEDPKLGKGKGDELDTHLLQD